MANFEKEMSFELVASDGTYTIGYIDEKPAEWDGNTVEPTVGMEFRMKSDGDTFGVNSQDEYIVENERWVENTVPLRMINRFPWETIVYYMDDDIREQVHSELAPCSTEEFQVN